MENCNMPCWEALEVEQREKFLDLGELRWVRGFLYSERLHESNKPWELPNTRCQWTKLSSVDSETGETKGWGYIKLGSHLLYLGVTSGKLLALCRVEQDGVGTHFCLAILVAGAVGSVLLHGCIFSYSCSSKGCSWHVQLWAKTCSLYGWDVLLRLEVGCGQLSLCRTLPLAC